MDLTPLERALEFAKAAGADAADAIITKGSSLGVSVRNGELEDLSRSEGEDLGLRVLVGQRQACVSTSRMDDDAINELAQRAVAMAKVAPEDPYAGLASQDQLAKNIPGDLDLWDDTELSPEQLQSMAFEAEACALDFEGITNSEGGSAGYGTGAVALATSEGFQAQHRSSSYSLSLSVVGGNGTKMERDYDFSTKRHFEDLPHPTAIGGTAASRTLNRLNPRKVKSCQVPIVFGTRVSKSLLGHFASAINGASVARGTSFLKDRMGDKVFADGIQVLDDPLIKRGLASKPFDGEGLATRALTLVENGQLENWILDLATARQLGLESNGRAARGTSSPPSPSSTNLYMAAGEPSFEDMIGEIENGFYINELIGMGVNPVTGDYSRGASGMWIENGELAYPVNEVTISGNLKDMFLNMTPADDLRFDYGTNAPSVRVDGLTIAGG